MKTAEGLVAAFGQELVPRLVEVLGDLVGRRLLLVQDLRHHAGAPGIDGAADCARIHIEELRGHLAHLRQSRAPVR